MNLKKEKRILLFSLAYEPFWGGAEIAIKEITKRNSDIEFDIITLRFDSNLPKFEKKDNLNIYRIGFTKNNPTSEELVKFPMYLTKIFYPVLACIKATSLNKTRHYNVMWAMMAYAGFGAVLFKIFNQRIPYILTLQEGDPVEHMTGRLRIKIVYPILKMVFKKPEIVQVISNYLAGYARNMGYKGKIEVVPNGVDIEKFNPDAQEGRDSDRKRRRKVVLITTSRLVEKNALSDVIKSLKYLPENVVFEILGDGPLEKDLKSLSFDLGLSGRVLFRGHVDNSELPEYLHKADIFIRPSLSEGMGSSFVEAMAAGLPVIATPVGGIVDFLKDGETGLVCRVKDPKSIAEKVKLLIEDKSLYELITKNASKMVAKRYDWDLIAKDMRSRVFDHTNTLNKVTSSQKILIATGIYPPDIGGPATYSKILKDELPNHGFDVEVLSFGGVRYLPKVLRHIVYFFQVLIEGKDRDIIFAQDPVSVGLPAVLASKILGRKFVLKVVGDYAWEQYMNSETGGGDLLDEFQNKKYGRLTELRRMVQKYVARNSFKIIVPSNYLKKIVSDGWGIDSGKISVIYNSFEENNFDVSKEEARKVVNLDGDILMSAGRLVSWKGFDCLIDTVSDLVKENDELKLVIAGGGPEQSRLMKKIESRGLSGEVLLVGSLSKARLMQYIRASDLFVLNTGYEGFSHQLLEVMSAETPIITTDIGGNPELIEKDKEGLLISYNNKEELKGSITKLLNDKKLSSDLVKGAKVKVSKFGKDKMLASLTKELKNI